MEKTCNKNNTTDTAQLQGKYDIKLVENISAEQKKYSKHITWDMRKEDQTQQKWEDKFKAKKKFSSLLFKFYNEI